MGMFWKTIANLWRTAQNYTPAPAVAPPITHKVETKWTPISHNGELRKTCGFVPPTQGYAPCTREPHSSGPCAHTLLKRTKTPPRSTLYHFTIAPRVALLPQDDGLSFEVFIEATRRRDAAAIFRRYFPEFVYTELCRVKP